MHIEFKNLCNAIKHMNMHISNAINQKFMSLLPLLVCFSCPRNFDPSLFFNVAPSLSISMSNLYFFISISPKAFISTISILKLSYLYTISPPLSSISIKGVRLIDTKICIWGRWLRLESCIFMDIFMIVGYLHDCWNGTTCRYHL